MTWLSAACGAMGAVVGVLVVLATAGRVLLREAYARVWEMAYSLGAADEQTSQDWTGGQVPPARQNPYRKEGP